METSSLNEKCCRHEAGCSVSFLASHPWAQNPQRFLSSEGWDRREQWLRHLSLPVVHRGTKIVPLIRRVSKATVTENRNRTTQLLTRSSGYPAHQGC